MLKNVMNKLIQWKVMLVIQILISIVLAVLLIQLNVLPMMYIIMIIVLEILLGVGIFFLMRNAQKVKVNYKSFDKFGNKYGIDCWMYGCFKRK